MGAGKMAEIFANELFQGLIFGQDEMNGAEYRACQFVQCSFEGTSVAVTLIGCSFEGCDFKDAGFEGAAVTACNFDSTSFEQSIFEDVFFTDCNLENTRFFGCNLFAATFYETKLHKSQIVDCDARFIQIENCDLSTTSVDDTDFSGANLEFALGLRQEQVDSAEGDLTTRLPKGIDRPAHWAPRNGTETDDAPEVAQLPAPLQVIWRDSQLVQKPRNDESDVLRREEILTIYRQLRSEVASFCENQQSNHPTVLRVARLRNHLDVGLASMNAVALGFEGEVLRSQLAASREELSATQIASLQGILTGTALLTSQFPSWRSIIQNTEVTEAPQKTQTLAIAINELADGIRRQNSLFDRKIADSLASQAEALNKAPEPPVIQSAANSANNVVSELAKRLWRKAKNAAQIAQDESLKILIRDFFADNREKIRTILGYAPKALDWVVDFFQGLFP